MEVRREPIGRERVLAACRGREDLSRERRVRHALHFAVVEQHAAHGLHVRTHGPVGAYREPHHHRPAGTSDQIVL